MNREWDHLQPVASQLSAAVICRKESCNWVSPSSEVISTPISSHMCPVYSVIKECVFSFSVVA